MVHSDEHPSPEACARGHACEQIVYARAVRCSCACVHFDAHALQNAFKTHIFFARVCETWLATVGRVSPRCRRRTSRVQPRRLCSRFDHLRKPPGTRDRVRHVHELGDGMLGHWR